MLTWIEIKKQAIKHNLGQFKKIIGPKVKLMAVVKSNAYGHGMVEIAKIALKSGANWLGVANLDEALMLRRAKIKAPIFILSYWEMIDQVKEAIKQNIDFPVYTFEQAEFLSKAAKSIKKKINIHIKIDTGATRIGVSTEEAVNFIKNPPEGVRIIEIAPPHDIVIGRATRNLKLLKAAYQTGIDYGRKHIETYQGTLHTEA